MGLTRRFLNRVGLGEDGDGDESGNGKKDKDLEKAWGELREGKIDGAAEGSGEKDRLSRFQASIEGREQAMPADAVLASEDADDVCCHWYLLLSFVLTQFLFPVPPWYRYGGQPARHHHSRRRPGR